jgi:hypothetical protein
MEYQSTLIESNYPREFRQAVKQYTDAKFVFRSVIWRELQIWRQYVQRNPEYTPSCWSPPSPSDDSVSILHLKMLITAAVFYGQKDILQALSETAILTQAPEPDLDSVHAVIAAFRQLFKGGGEDGWPLKPEVRAAATDILKKTGLPIPESDRQWTRIFNKAGLSKLRQSRRQSKRAKL